jgi:rod shape determining protein RodA
MAIGRTVRDEFDWPLFIAVSTIALFGVLNLYSATESGTISDAYVQQLYWLLLGFAVATLVVAVDYRHFERYGWLIYAVCVLALILVLVLGKSVRGSTRWISLGAFSLQPSELMKIGLILALAKYLHHDTKIGGRTLVDLIIPGLILALPMSLVLIQPDLGMAMMLAFIFGSIMMLTELKRRSLVTLLTGFVVAAPITWVYLLRDYQKERIVAFWDRLGGNQTDILDSGWHAHQSLVAIGSGGWGGKGFTQGTQTRFRFLPDQHTDFPFPVWAEEHGFIGALLLIGLYLFLVLWSLRIASQAKDRFGAVVAVGVGAMIFWQTVINLGMVSGLLPVVGMTLPLFSYGGSSLLSTMIGLGLLMNVSMRRFSH